MQIDRENLVNIKTLICRGNRIINMSIRRQMRISVTYLENAPNALRIIYGEEILKFLGWSIGDRVVIRIYIDTDHVANELYIRRALPNECDTYAISKGGSSTSQASTRFTLKFPLPYSLIEHRIPITLIEHRIEDEELILELPQ